MKSEFIKKFKSLTPFLIITIFLLITYYNSFTTGFQLDDNHTILNNPTIGYLKKFSDPGRWLIPFYNRQLPYLTFSLNFLQGGYNVFYYHLTNFLLHLINSFLVYGLILLLFKSNAFNDKPILRFKEKIALFTSLIFALHPVQVQVVTYITQRMVSLAILFYILAIYFYLKARLLQITGPGNLVKYIYFLISFISFILGIFSKEIIYSLPLTLILIEIIFLRESDKSRSSKFIYTLSGIIVAGTALIFFTRGIPAQSEAPSIYNYFLTELQVLITYIRLLVVPINQHLFYHFPVSNSLFEPAVLASGISLIILLFAGIILLKRKPMISFGILMFFILLAIESSIIPLKYVIFEYRLYPVVIGFGLILSTLIFNLKIKNVIVPLTILSIITITFSILTINQNYYWKDGITLWQQNIDAAPLNPVPHNNLGTYYYSKKEYDKAIQQYTRAIKLDSNYSDAYNHRGIAFRDRNMFLTALSDFNKAIELSNKNPMYWNNKGYTYQGMGLIDSAIFYYRKAIHKSPDYHNALNNLSIAFQLKNQPDSALYYSNGAIKVNPYNSRYYNNRGNIFFMIGDYDNAHLNFIKALEIEPENAKALNNLATVLMKRNFYKEAIPILTEAIKIDTDYPDPLFNRGYCFMMISQYELAGRDFYECLRLNPNHQGAKECIKYISSKY
ncbi:MAG TPA: tetratricopeptide repeat protein [Melioribacteraceae bacterium]|nr:tetratricopeptide repeat protein [Melioribacteraceae bacterium]